VSGVVKNLVFSIAVALLLNGESYGEERITRQCVPLVDLPSVKSEAYWVRQANIGLRSKRILNRPNNVRDTTTQGYKEITAGHQITAGKGDVLVWRQHFPGWPSLSDTGLASAISISIPERISGAGHIDLRPNGGATAFLSSGQPGMQNYCYGASRGELSFETNKQDDYENEVEKAAARTLKNEAGRAAVLIHVSLEATLTSTRSSPNQCGKCVMDANIYFESRNIRDMSTER
jgi:hypothetical protein